MRPDPAGSGRPRRRAPDGRHRPLEATVTELDLHDATGVGSSISRCAATSPSGAARGEVHLRHALRRARKHSRPATAHCASTPCRPRRWCGRRWWSTCARRAPPTPTTRCRPRRLTAWEAAHGRIPPGSAVLVMTGWDSAPRRPRPVPVRPPLPGPLDRRRPAAGRPRGGRDRHRHARHRPRLRAGLPGPSRSRCRPACGTSRGSSTSTSCRSRAPGSWPARCGSRTARVLPRG